MAESVRELLVKAPRAHVRFEPDGALGLAPRAGDAHNEAKATVRYGGSNAVVRFAVR